MDSSEQVRISNIKRTKRAAKEARLAKVSSMLLRGITTHKAIADELGMGVRSIGLYVAELEKRWRQQQIADVDVLKQMKVRELDEIKVEAWRSFESSKKNRHRVTRRAIEGQEGKAEMTTIVEEQYGDPRFLGLIRECINDQADILGLRVTKVAQTTPDGRSIASELIMKAVEISEAIGDGATIVDASTIRNIADAAAAAEGLPAGDIIDVVPEPSKE